MKKLLITLLIFSAYSYSAGENDCGSLEKCDAFSSDVHDLYSLQRGLGIYMNYCASCHSLKLLRWNRLQKDLAIPENIVTEELIRTPDTKIADHMTFGMPEISPIGAPDLTLRTRVRGDEWIYTYLRTFYEDPLQTSGANNLVYVGTSMPNVLVGLQGNQALDKDGKLIKISEGSVRDSLSLRKFLDNQEPGVEMKSMLRCNNCFEESEVDLPIGTSFFWPDS